MLGLVDRLWRIKSCIGLLGPRGSLAGSIRTTSLGGRSAIGFCVSSAWLWTSLMAAGCWAAQTDANPPIGAADLGRQVYEQKCAACHGPNGQGMEGVYDPALAGERSAAELARLIERTMPEGEPEECVGPEAEAVARYMHDAFYSPAARLRLGLDPPMQVEMLRLSVPQYRHAVADLLAHFTPAPQGKEEAQPVEAGLRGTYFASEGMSKANKLVDSRLDRRLEFDFGEGVPFPDLPPDQFAIVWEGSLSVPETGEYHLRVNTPNGARVYLNLDPSNGLHKLRDDSAAAGQFPLIDAWVGSGTVREESARVFLLGGRQYPLRVEFFKYKEPTASLRVEWKPPQGVWSVLDDQHLTSGGSRRTFVVETGFPADDRSLGFERGSSVSLDWYAAVTEGAVATAEEVINRLPLLSGVAPLTKEQLNDPAAQAARVERLQAFVARFATVAFRRPLQDDERARLSSGLFVDPANPETAVRQAIVWVLCSPSFLFTELPATEVGPSSTGLPPANLVANRLALSLWDSLPDEELGRAAEAGELATAEGIAQRARRMLADERTRFKLRAFFQRWLLLEQRDLTKDATLFPDFDEAVAADWRTSLEMLIDEVVWSETSDYRQLFTTSELWMNDRLRQAWDVEPTVPTGTELKRSGTDDAGTDDAGTDVPKAAAASSAQDTQLPAAFLRLRPDDQRAGVLTHPYVLSALAYHNNTSPIHRGVFVTRSVLGRPLRSPPVAIAFENDEFPPDLTMREKVTHLTKDASCQSCHTIINPLGFALERFDAVGRLRDTESGRPIDTRSPYETEDGEMLAVSSPQDLAALALSSAAAQRVFVAQLFQHMTQQLPGAYGPDVLAELTEGFRADEFNIQKLMVRIAVVAATHVSQTPLESSAPEASAPE